MSGDYNWTLLSLFSSLTNRIFVASALLAVVSIAIGIYHVNIAVGAQAEQELLRGLAEAQTLIEENRRIQVEHFTTRCPAHRRPAAAQGRGRRCRRQQRADGRRGNTSSSWPPTSSS